MRSGRLKIFFSGIGGSGMSAIAGFMADKGHSIAGSDRSFDHNPDHPVSSALRAKGIRLVPQDGSGIDASFDFAVFSTAVESDRPEVIRAREIGLPMKTRPEYLAEIVKDYETIAVAGTSGKSTTSGMLAFLMERLGMEPNFIGGGRVKQFRTPTNPGNAITGDSKHLVIEACESDGTIVHYRPTHSLLLNLDLDHHPVDETSSMFGALKDNTSGMLVVNGDDDRLRAIVGKEAITFSISHTSRYRAEHIASEGLGMSFSLRGVRFGLSIPGRHNVGNALACIAFLSETGVPLQEIAEVLPEFKGIERRFDVVLDEGGMLVIDDYAHNPHKIASLMETMRNLRDRVRYIFQPHGFGPTRMMKKEYIEAFTSGLREADRLILLPIYYAGGTAARDISSHALAEGIEIGGRSVEVVESREAVLSRLGESDAWVVFGARDETLSDFAHAIAESLQIRQ